MKTASRLGRGRAALARVAALLALGAGAGCDFHDGRFSGEFNAGGADPYNYPPPFRGTGAARHIAASGVFTEVGAYVNGQRIGYFSFPFSPGQVATTGYPPPAGGAWPEGNVDPLRLAGPGTDFRRSVGNPAPVPLAYVFDPPGGASPFPSAPSCRAPEGYTQDRFEEAFPKNEQWNVFTFTPDRFASFPFAGLPTWVYRPIVAEVPVTTKDLSCQAVKSERTLLNFADQGRMQVPRGEPEPDGVRFGKPNGRFLAWALIDPGAAVVRVGQTVNLFEGGSVSGTSVQRYGWYGQFIVAYLDGGYIPTEPGPNVTDPLTRQPTPTVRARTQRLYYPRSPVVRTGATAAAPGTMGQGYDVLQANRFGGGEGYSPICEVWSYDLGAETAQADLPRDEATILARAGSTLEPARTTQSPTAYTPSPAIVPRYVFCLQVAPLE